MNSTDDSPPSPTSSDTETSAATVRRIAIALLGSQAEVDAVWDDAAGERGETPRGVSDATLGYALIRRALWARLARRGPGAVEGAEVDGNERDTPAAIRHWLEKLRPSEREGLVLCSVGKLELSEIATVCGVTTTETYSGSCCASHNSHVKLVIIYGAPGVGKLTTARALAALTGFRLFHNHLAFDLAKAIFDFPSPPFAELSEKVRLAAFEAAARAKLPGLIFTFVYASPDDDPFMRKVIEIVEGHGGEVALRPPALRASGPRAACARARAQDVRQDHQH